MKTYTRDLVPWNLRDHPSSNNGALSEDSLTELSARFDLDSSALRQLSRKLDMALPKELHIAQIEFGDARVEKGVKQLQLAIRELESVRNKLSKVHNLLGEIKLKNMFSHTGMPSPANAHLERFDDIIKGIADFASYLDTMARHKQAVYTGVPDRRRISDIRRSIVCTSIFNFWGESGRQLTYTTNTQNSKRGGELFDFVNAVVRLMTSPACDLSGEAIKFELKAFKGNSERS